MNTVERVLTLCKGRKCPVSRLERELGYGNGYMKSLTKGELPADRAKEIACYFDIPVDFLLGGTDEYGLTFDEWNHIGFLFCNYASQKDKYESYVAYNAGIPMQRVTWFFAGAVNLSGDEVKKIADCLNVPLADVIGIYAEKFSEKDLSSSRGEYDYFSNALHEYGPLLSDKDKGIIIGMMKRLAKDVKESKRNGDVE